MSRQEVEELREKTNEELEKLLEETQRELFNLRFRLATMQLKNYREVKKVKRRLARIKTILRERGIRR